MDLTIKDVAALLNLSKSTVDEWVAQGTIPCYRIGDQYRFSRIEIEDWVLRKQSGELSANGFGEADIHGTGSRQFSLYRAIHKGGVLHKVPGKEKEEVIRNAMKTIAKDLKFDPDVLTEMLIDRERLQPTALGHGIGLPHTRDSFVNALHDRVVVAFPEHPLQDYGALDGEPVTTLFFLFACDDKKHLHLLAKIAHFSNLATTLELLERKPNKVALLDYVKEWEGQVGKVLSAGKTK